MRPAQYRGSFLSHLNVTLFAVVLKCDTQELLQKMQSLSLEKDQHCLVCIVKINR